MGKEHKSEHNRRIREGKDKSSLIQLQNVSKIYNMGDTRVTAVKDVSLRVNKGDFLAITGPSGSGKSTLMNLVGSLDVPTEGDIYLDNHNIAHLSESSLAQLRGKKIGFVFQQFNLIRNLSALENVMLPMTFQGVPEDVREKKAKKILESLELGDRLDHLPKELSGGQQQRVAIARALSNDPEVILADEPTGNLDSKTGKNVLEILKGLNDKGKTIIIVTHDNDIASHAKRIVMIRDGMIIEDKKR